MGQKCKLLFSSYLIVLLCMLFLLSCGGSAGNSGTSVNSITGKVADGYLINATVCVDLNENGRCDCDSEPCTWTDDNGTYSLNVSSSQKNYYIVAEVIKGTTIDKDDNNPVDANYTLMSPPPEMLGGNNTIIVTPITTMVANKLKVEPGLTIEDAKTSIGNKLKIYNNVLNDYIADGNKTIHNIARVVAKGIANGLTQLASRDYNSTIKLSYITDLILDNISSILYKIQNSTSDLNSTKIKSYALSVVNSSSVNASKLEDYQQKITTFSASEKKTPINVLPGIKLYGLTIRDGDNGTIYEGASELYFDGDSENGRLSIHRESLSNIEAPSDLASGDDHTENEYYQANGTNLELKRDLDSSPHIRISSIKTIDLNGKTTKVSFYLFDTDENSLEKWNNDTNATFAEGDQSYCLSLVSLEEDPVEVGRTIDTSDNIQDANSTYSDLEEWVNEHNSANKTYANYNGGYPKFYFKPSADETLRGEIWAVDNNGTEYKVGSYWPVTDSENHDTYLVVDKGAYRHDGVFGEVFRCINGKIYGDDFHIKKQPINCCLLNDSAFQKVINAIKQ